MGQMSVKSWSRVCSDSRRMRIRTEKRMRISRAACTFSGFLMTSTILARRTLSLLAYLSLGPA